LPHHFESIRAYKFEEFTLSRQYEILGLMPVYIEKDGEDKAIARENVVEVTMGN